MKTAGIAIGLAAGLALSPARGQTPEYGKVFQSHTPDGLPYYVVLCLQADECFEYAYQFCQGPYRPLDKSFYPANGFRFICGGEVKPHRKQPQKNSGE